MLKGFMIFLMATAWLVSWSLAELQFSKSSVLLQSSRGAYQTRPNAPMPTGCKSVYLHGGVSPAQSGRWGRLRTCWLSRTSCRKSAHARILPW